MKIPLTQIIIKERQRVDLGDCSELATSFQEVGQIQAIGVNERNELVWGRRRLEAARLLGWSEIEVVQRTGLTPEMEQEIEYEEDARRKDRTWQEKCLAVAKLKRLKEKRTGDDWSLRKMADFTGFSKSSIGYMLQVADALNAVPKDDEAWACDNYMAAVKLLVLRTERMVNAELERRRQSQVEPPPAVTTDGIPSPTPVQQLDTTAPEKPTVRIHGRPIAFKDAVEDEHFYAGRAMCVIGVSVPPEAFPNIIKILHPNGYAVLWKTFVAATEKEIKVMPYPLIWNQLNPPVAEWPFSPNFTMGRVVSVNEPHGQNNRSSVISVADTGDGHLPASLVAHCIDGCLGNGSSLPVYCIGGVRPVHVAQNGQTPIWFEPDPLKFEEYVAELRAHYEETIPGVEVIVK